MQSINQPRIFVASPIYNDQCYGSYASSLLDLQKRLIRSGYDFSFEWTKNVSRISLARNILFSRFLRDDSATHLLFIDADMAFEAADIMRMLDYDHGIMAALCPKKLINWDRVISAVRENPEINREDLSLVAGQYGTFNALPGQKNIPVDEPFPIESAGTGIMLIRREVFIRMSEAYPDLKFRVSENEAPFFPGVDYLPALFNEMASPDGGWLGEDLSFCQRWRDIGGQVHGCAWFNVRHIGTYEYASNMRSIAKYGLSVN